eukprot:12465138-Ditylum_brightwellii.AAC.1
MASLFGSLFAILIARVLNRSTTHNALGTLITGGDGRLLKDTHCMHDMIALLDSLIDLVLDKCVVVFDLFGAHAMLLGTPIGILNKPDMLEPLFCCDVVSGLNMLPVSLIMVAFLCVMVAKSM